MKYCRNVGLFVIDIDFLYIGFSGFIGSIYQKVYGDYRVQSNVFFLKGGIMFYCICLY